MVLVLNVNLKDFEGCTLHGSTSDGEGLSLFFDCGDVYRVLLVMADCGDLVVEDDSLAYVEPGEAESDG